MELIVHSSVMKHFHLLSNYPKSVHDAQHGFRKTPGSRKRYCPRPSSLLDIYLCDLPDAVRHSSARLFADDSLLYRGTKDRHDQALLQEDMDSLG